MRWRGFGLASIEVDARLTNQNNEGAKRGDIQGLRAFAAIAVVLFHASSLLPGGFLGVDVFFVISGFIIVHVVNREIASTHAFRFKRFLKRRMLRIFPPMILVVLVTIALGAVIDTPSGTASTLPMTGIAALTGVVNYYFLLSATDYFQSFHTNPLLHLWSLSVEIQFYILFAVIAKIGLTLGLEGKVRSGLAGGMLVAVTTLLFLASISIEYWADHVGITQPRFYSFFMLFPHLWEFGLGALAFMLHKSCQTRNFPSFAINLVQFCAAAAILAGFVLGTDTVLVPGTQAIAPVVGAALLIATGPRGIVSRFLSWPVFQFLGDRSYSIYIWQGPLIVFGAMLFAPPMGSAAGAVASVLVSLVLFRSVEQKPRNLDSLENRTFRKSLALGGTYVFVLALLIASQMLVLPLVQRFQAPAPVRATSLDEACERQRGVPGLEPCIYGRSSGQKLLLVGDSHAGAVSQAVVDAADSVGWQAIVATASACALPEYPENVSYRASCSGYAQDVTNYARNQGVRMVIMQQFSEFYVDRLGVGLPRWRSGLKEFVDTLASSGIKVLIVGDNLGLPISVGRPIWVDQWSVDLSSSIEARRGIEMIESQVAAENDAAEFLPARQFLCANSICPVFDNGKWLYTDTDHLSYLGAEPLSAPIADAIRRAQAD